MFTETLQNGKIRYGEAFVNPLTNKWQRVSVTMDKDTRSNRIVASKLLQEKKDRKLEELLSTKSFQRLTLSSLYNLYFEYLKDAVKKSTLKRNITAGNGMMKLLGKDTLVCKLNAVYVKGKLLKAKEHPGTTNERIKRFKAMIRWAYESEHIEDVTWLDKIKPIRDEDRKRKLEEKFLETDELSALLSAMSHPVWRFLTELMALSGMRCGEAIALETSDVDFEKRIIHVTKTYDHVHKLATSPKTEDSNREIYMQDQLYQLCINIREYFTSNNTKLFMHQNGDYLGYAGYNKYLRQISRETLGREITTHFLRHTHVALLSEQGLPLDLIARRLGHSDSKITKRIYFHVTNQLKEKENMMLKDIKIL